MSRNEEYQLLLSQLDDAPPALAYVVPRARARAAASKRLRRCFAIPAGSLAALFIAFVVVVNSSVTAAAACGRIPLLRELAAAVTFSPSLSAAVENQYVQPIDLEQSQNGITMRIEYVIVDQKQLNIFYSLQSDIYSAMDAAPSIRKLDGSPLGGYSVSTGSYGEENGALRQFTVDFTNRDVPDGLTLSCRIHDNGSNDVVAAPVPMDSPQAEEDGEPDVISAFSFALHFDPAYTQKGEVLTLNQDFMLDGQHLTATTVEIYPSHIRLNLADDEHNTAWLQSLSFYLENEKGERFEAIRNGITATGSADSPMMASHRLESTYFSQSQGLTLVITDVIWLDKEMERVEIDLARETANILPEGVSLEQALRTGNDWQLTFSGIEQEEHPAYQLFGLRYYDDAGTEYEYNSWSSGGNGYVDAQTGAFVELPGKFTLQFALTDYPYDTVTLSPSFSRAVALETPVALTVK